MYCVSLSVLVARELKGEFAVDLCLICRVLQNAFLTPATLLAASYHSYIPPAPAYIFSNLILSCMCLVNNFKLLLEQGRVELKK